MTETTYTGPRVRVQLVGEDGNAFFIMGRITLAMRRAGFSRDAIAAYRRRAMSGDYSHLLAVSMEYCEDEADEVVW